jgi:hypothetical protein
VAATVVVEAEAARAAVEVTAAGAALPGAPVGLVADEAPIAAASAHLHRTRPWNDPSVITPIASGYANATAATSIATAAMRL